MTITIQSAVEFINNRTARVKAWEAKAEAWCVCLLEHCYLSVSLTSISKVAKGRFTAEAQRTPRGRRDLVLALAPQCCRRTVLDILDAEEILSNFFVGTDQVEAVRN